MKTLRNALTALLTALLIMGTLPFTALAADNTAGAPAIQKRQIQNFNLIRYSRHQHPPAGHRGPDE